MYINILTWCEVLLLFIFCLQKKKKREEGVHMTNTLRKELADDANKLHDLYKFDACMYIYICIYIYTDRGFLSLGRVKHLHSHICLHVKSTINHSVFQSKKQGTSI